MVGRNSNHLEKKNTTSVYSTVQYACYIHVLYITQQSSYTHTHTHTHTRTRTLTHIEGKVSSISMYKHLYLHYELTLQSRYKHLCLHYELTL